MARFLRLVLGVVALIVIMTFAIANRAPVAVSFAPLPIEIELPLYGVFLIGLVLGVLVGGLGVWLGAFGQRREARRMRNKVWALENQLNVIRQQEARAQAEGRAPGGAMVPSPG